MLMDICDGKFRRPEKFDDFCDTQVRDALPAKTKLVTLRFWPPVIHMPLWKHYIETVNPEYHNLFQMYVLMYL